MKEIINCWHFRLNKFYDHILSFETGITYNTVLILRIFYEFINFSVMSDLRRYKKLTELLSKDIYWPAFCFDTKINILLWVLVFAFNVNGLGNFFCIFNELLSICDITRYSHELWCLINEYDFSHLKFKCKENLKFCRFHLEILNGMRLDFMNKMYDVRCDFIMNEQRCDGLKSLKCWYT